MPCPLYIALIHYPVTNKLGEVVTTSVTNFDLHDISRNSATYGLAGFFVVTPSATQQSMVTYIRDYWREGKGAEFNPDRRQAFDRLFISSTLEETCLTIKKAHDKQPLLIATSAKGGNNALSFQTLKDLIQSTQKAAKDEPVLILFGTGWGLVPEVLAQCDYLLAPIKGPTDYNHLPVRSAVAIVLDRLLGH